MPNNSDQSKKPEIEEEKFRNSPWMKKISTLERILCFVIVLSLLIVAAMVAVLYFFAHALDSTHNNNLCLTPECVKTAAEVLSNLDENVDPCQDFYRFACGGWLNRHTIPEDKAEVSAVSDLYDDLYLKLRILLEKEQNGTEPRFFKMIKDMYDSCMDLNTIEKAGAEPLKRVLKDLGGWPVVEGRKWNHFIFDWVETLMALRKFGYDINILLDLSVTPDSKNNTVHIFNLDETLLGMPDRTYLVRGLHDTSTAAYYQLMVKSAKLLGADEATAEIELLKALHFEMALANYSLPREERRDESKFYHKYTVEQLQEEVPQVPWLKYFNGLLNTKIYENETLIVAVPEFVKNFADLITKTEKRVIANYMLCRVVSQSLSTLSKEFRDILQEYNSVVSGASEEEPRWKQCISSVNENLGIALGSYYVRNYFSEDSKNGALVLVKYVSKEFLRILEEIVWMDERTRKHAIEKAHTIKSFIGYPKELLNDTAVAEKYKNLTITKENYFENILRVSKWSRDESFSQLRKPSKKDKWDNHAFAAVVNAFYDPIENSIEFPAGILQKDYFNKERPYFMNFGSLGSTFGHEITHGFDDAGRQYDKDGNMINWWDKKTDELFTEKTQCMIDQYNNYIAENGMRLNGLNTLGENIADNGGLKEAYWAYQSWVEDNGQEQLLPGLNYTQNQLFWISSAAVYCTKTRPEAIQLYILSDSHSLNEFRVTGPLSNLEEFSKDFNCPPDSPMNKKEKCEVW